MRPGQGSEHDPCTTSQHTREQSHPSTRKSAEGLGRVQPRQVTGSDRPINTYTGSAAETATRLAVEVLNRKGRSRLAAASAVGEGDLCRLVNVAAALVLLVLAAPVLLLVGLLVKATSPGPVLFVQERVGLDRRLGGSPNGKRRRRLDLGGKPFKMLKFRTMYLDPSTNGTPQVWARPDDPRVTPVGRLLREYRLDELPQLVNVLRGDMNLVGPRPEQPEIFQELRSQIEGYYRRQRVLPGITGWAQVQRPYDQSLDDVRRKVDLDLEYIDRRSALGDLKIIAQTVPVVLFRRGAW